METKEEEEGEDIGLSKTIQLRTPVPPVRVSTRRFVVKSSTPTTTTYYPNTTDTAALSSSILVLNVDDILSDNSDNTSAVLTDHKYRTRTRKKKKMAKKRGRMNLLFFTSSKNKQDKEDIINHHFDDNDDSALTTPKLTSSRPAAIYHSEPEYNRHKSSDYNGKLASRKIQINPFRRHQQQIPTINTTHTTDNLYDSVESGSLNSATTPARRSGLSSTARSFKSAVTYKKKFNSSSDTETMRHLHQHSLLDGANSLASYNNIITSTLHRRSISVSSLFGSLGRQQQQQQEKQHRLQHNNNHQQLHREQQQQSFHYSSDDLESVVDSISTARSYSLHYNILHHQHRCQSSLRPRATDMHVMNCEDEEIENADRLLVQAQEEQQLRTLAAEIIFQPEFYGRDKQLLNDDDHNSLYSTLNPPNNNYYKYNGPVLLDLDVNADDDAIGGGSDENVKVILDEDTTLITENTSTFMMIGETESVNSSTEILKPDIPLLIVSDVSVVNTDSRDEGFITRNSTCSQPHPTTASSVNDQPASQSSPAESVSLNSPSPSPSPSPLLPILLPSSFDQNAPATLRTTKTTWGRVKKTLNHARRQSISSIHSILPASLLRKKREDVGNSGTQGGEDESIGLESTQVQINTPPPLSTLQPPIISFNKRRSVMSISSLIGKYIDYSSDDEDEEDGSTRSGKELSEMVTSPTLALDHQSTIDSGRKSIRKFSDIGRRFSRSISSASLTAATNSSSSRQINIAPPPTSSSKKWSFVSFSNYKSTVSPQSTPVIETGTSSSTALPLDDDHKSPKFYTYHLQSTTDETLPPASTTTATTTIPIISRRVLSDRQLDRIAKRMSTATMNGDVTVLDVELRDMYLQYLSSPLAILDDDHLLRKKEEDEHLLSRRSQQINNHRRQQQNVPHLDMKFGFEQIEEENEEEEKVQL